MTVVGINELNVLNEKSKFENYERIESGKSADIQTYLTAKIDDNVLFQYDNTGSISHLSSKYKTEVGEIFKIAGFYDLTFEFTPNNSVPVRLGSDVYYVEENGIKNSFPKKIETYNDYEGWFGHIFNCFEGPVLLIPDTNILIYCYYSNYLKKMIDDSKNKASIELSRLTLMEIERQANDAKNRVEKTEDYLNSIKEDKDKQKEDKDKQKEDKDKQKALKSLKDSKRTLRLRFQTMGEIVEITKDGGKLFPYNDMLIKSFDKASGFSFADSWIRWEIQERMKVVRVSNLIFLTSDLVSALMSRAENINTIYVYNTKENRKKKNIIDNLIYTTSVLFENCKIEISGNYTDKVRTFDLKSIWNGKSHEDWCKRKVDFKYSDSIINI